MIKLAKRGRKKNNKVGKDKDKSKLEWLSKLLQDEDKLYSNRINFFILSQSLLIVSYSSSIIFFKDNINNFKILISILALFVTGIFTIIFHRTVDFLDYLKRELRDSSPNYKKIWDLKKNRENKRILGINILVGEITSIFFFTIWIFLLFFSLHIKFYTMYSFVYFLFFIAILTYSLCQILKDTHFSGHDEV